METTCEAKGVVMNGLTLVIVNEGQGYEQRRLLGQHANRELFPRYRFVEWASIVARHAKLQRVLHDKNYTVSDLAQSIVELDEYYRQRAEEDT